MDKKVVIITGASSGIGLACAIEFSGYGYKVVMAARNIDKLSVIQQEILKSNPDILALKVDVSIEEDCKRLVEETINKFGRIDVLINNAGISMRALFKDLDLKVLHKLMDTNFWGTVYCTKYALPYILAQKGSIVGISSIAGFMGLPARTGYSASKFAMHGFLETLRIEHLKQHLHVMIVAPGFTSSNIRKTALGADGNVQRESPRDENKMMSAENVAHHIYKGVQKRKRLIVLTTKGKLAVLFKKFVPRLLEYFDYLEMKKEPNSPLS
ncbi:MAG: SDR family oxidoreductase [Bacteroidota bacterium]|nr:SDR family oxidoreductase [Bacteroidota bacterium]